MSSYRLEKNLWLKSLFMFSLFLCIHVFKKVIFTAVLVWYQERAFSVAAGCHPNTELFIAQVSFRDSIMEECW